jgi:hypothetical protein
VLPVTELCEDGVDNDCNGEVDDVYDIDFDGWTACEGDCCEVVGAGCTLPALVNPGAIDVQRFSPSGAPTFTDDDCSGTAGDSRAACDQGVPLDDPATASAAAAVDVCRSVTQDPRSWGLRSVSYTTANGKQIVAGKQAGIAAAFGAQVIPQQGQRMLLLSSGHARPPGHAEACGSNSCKTGGTSTPPVNFPQQADGCAPVKAIYDSVALELNLRAPSNATGYRFSYRYWSFAKPGECDAYSDEFVVIVSPVPPGSMDGNIAFDALGTPISAKSSLFDICTGCPMGAGPLKDTGFDTWSTSDFPGGATGWLSSTAPVKPGEEFTLRFAIWDGGDQAMDSSVLVDNFEWLTESGVEVGTEPLAAAKSQSLHP